MRFKVLHAHGNILLVRFFRKIEHVRSKERFPVLGIKLFVGGEHAIKPGQYLFGAMVRVQNDGNAIVLGDGAHVHGQSHGTGGGVVGVFNGLADHKGASSVGNLNHDGGLGFASGLQDGVGCRRTVVVVVDNNNNNNNRRWVCQAIKRSSGKIRVRC